MIVNWVKEDEELLEPYEWNQGDDIEIISTMPYYHVDDTTLCDFIYGCLYIFDKDFYDKIFIVGNGKYALAIETDMNGELCFRSVLDFQSRHYINKQIRSSTLVHINYQKYDEAYLKVYGMTRLEREKKQYIEMELDELYKKDPQLLEQYFSLLGIEGNTLEEEYLNLLKELDTMYNQSHDLIYQIMTKQ